jgi:hypothetical protein
MKKIRLTEGALRKIVKESVRKVLSERTRFEAGLSDDEVSRMRTNRFANDVDPYYGDSIYDDEQERYADKMHGRRLSRHFATQKHKPNPLDTEVNEGSGDPYYGNKQQVRVSESQLHQIVKESVEQVLSEGWFGNDKRYGEKWWNPNTWMSDKEKREKDRIDKTLRDVYNKRKEWDKEREEAEYQRKMQISHQKHNTKTSPDVEKRTGYGDTTFGPADDGYFAGLR